MGMNLNLAVFTPRPYRPRGDGGVGVRYGCPTLGRAMAMGGAPNRVPPNNTHAKNRVRREQRQRPQLALLSSHPGFRSGYTSRSHSTRGFHRRKFASIQSLSKWRTYQLRMPRSLWTVHRAKFASGLLWTDITRLVVDTLQTLKGCPRVMPVGGSFRSASDDSDRFIDHQDSSSFT